MNIAFAIVSLFPGGGLQRDCVALAGRLRARGHTVTLFAARVADGIDAGPGLEILPNRAWSNHGRNRRFAVDLARRCAGRFDCIVGFDKLSGLDVLYCADPSIAGRHANSLLRWTPRRRILTALEQACFAPGTATRLLLLSGAQVKAYRQAWDTEAERITLLPPTVDIGRRKPHLRSDGTRERMRASLGVEPHHRLWLAIGLQPHVKGLDRIQDVLGSDPEAHLVVVGLSEESKAAQALRRWAKRDGCSGRIRLLGIRQDIPELMAAADLLVHPARYETTGTAILEAIVNGLPVVTTAVCGYAEHVTKAQAGVVLPEPFDPRALMSALEQGRDEARRALWSANAVLYAMKADLYRGLDRAAAVIAGES